MSASLRRASRNNLTRRRRKFTRALNTLAESAIRRALLERRRRLKGASVTDRRARVVRFLETKIWPTIPKDQLGRRLSREEEDAILGYGATGV